MPDNPEKYLGDFIDRINSLIKFTNYDAGKHGIRSELYDSLHENEEVLIFSDSDPILLSPYLRWIEFCFTGNPYPEFEELAPTERANIFNLFIGHIPLDSIEGVGLEFGIFQSPNLDYDAKLNITTRNERDLIVETVKSCNYNFNLSFDLDINSALILDLMLILRNGITIKKCSHCNKYFIPETKENEIYCNRVQTNGKTCKQLGWQNKKKAIEYKEYRKTYVAFKAFLKRNEEKYEMYECKTSLAQIFNIWNHIAKDKKDKLNPENLNPLEYIQWVEKYLEWIKISYTKIKELLTEDGDYDTFRGVCELDEKGVEEWLENL